MIDTVSCCGQEHHIIQWTDAGPRQYGAECAECGRRCLGETPEDVVAAFRGGEAGRERES